ncbi:MAG: EAL domain-containing protein [Gammaproteobacteria bacterium]
MSKFFRGYLKELGFRQQLIVAFALGILCLALLSSLTITSLSSATVRAKLVNTGRQVTENFAAQSTLALLYHSPENAEEAVRATLNFPDVLAVAIYNEQGVSLVEKGGKEHLRAPLGQPSPELRLEWENDAAWSFLAPVYTTLPADVTESPIDTTRRLPDLIGFVRVIMGKGTLDEMVADILRGNLTVSLVLAAVLLIVLLAITTRVTTPLKNLADLMRRAEQGEALLRAPLKGPKDVIVMETAFNTMMHVLEKREQELKGARDAALEVARIKSEFAANVSHELRTPLNVILGTLELLENANLTSQQADYVRTAGNAGNTLLALINNILDFSRIEAGKLQLKTEDLDPRELVDKLFDMFAGQAQRKGLEMGYGIDSEVPAAIRGDAARIQQVLINLLGNAIKFTDQGEVAIEVVLVKGQNANDQLRFAVRDTGIGIPDEAREMIFEAFSQADNSLTRRYQGTGLGLAICRGLVERMGGALGVESHLGKGSAFWFSLPLQAAQKLPERRDSESNIALALTDNPRILVVDGNALNGRYLAHLLRGWNCRCEIAASTTSALETLRSAASAGDPFAIAIVDQTLAELKSNEFRALIASDPTVAMTRIIVMSHAQESVNASVQLTKPVRKTQLLAALRATLKPAVIEARKMLPAPSSALPPHAGVGILVVEDNRANQIITVGMLERLGCKVTVAADGKQALEALQHDTYDMVLMDCQMPGLDGYEVTRRIRKLEAHYAHLPIIAITAHSQEGDSEQCFAAGMNDYLPKPFKLEMLREKLQRWLVPADAPQAVAANKAVIAQRTESLDGPLDDKVLRSLRDSIGDAFSQVIEVFLEDIQDYMDSLRAAITHDDAQALADVAHTVKGCSKNMGVHRLAEISTQLEELGRSGEMAGAVELLDGLAAEYERLKPLLIQYVRSDPIAPSTKGDEQTRILVVDDDRGSRLMLRSMLERDGYCVEEAATGIAALAICERRLPELVLLDAIIPDLNGFMVCERIRQQPDGDRIPVLMITALDDERSVERAFTAGATDYLPKPVHFAVLRKRVARLIQASRVEKHIRHIAYHDPLTGLPNRTAFVEHCQSISQNQPLAILFLDLDRFKLINDTLGHDVGDLLLKAAAERIKRSIRGTDFVARLAGDEFIITLNGASSLQAIARVAEKICNTLAQPFPLAGQEIYITTSVGIAMCPDDSRDIVALMKYADLAMYRAKEQGNSYHFYQQGMDTAASKRLTLESELRRALMRNEFILYYQPQASLKTGEIVGVEALIRWQHPQRGLLPPSEFIPAAEETGLISDIGEWILHEACGQAQKWRQSGISNLHMAVNISGRQLEQPRFADLVKAVLAGTGLPASLLELEITESALMRHPDEAIDTLSKLRKAGIVLAMDDFGTGYSSFNYLKRFTVDKLKIDRSFVKDIASDPDAMSIVRSIIALAKNLRLKIVAEGVETVEHKALLKDAECDLMQGYHLSKPLPALVLERQILVGTESVKEGSVKLLQRR